MSLPNRRGTWHSWPGALKINFWSWTESNTASEMKCLPPTIVFFRASMYQFIKQLETQLGTLHCWLNIHCVGPSFIQKYYNHSEQYQKVKLHPERKKPSCILVNSQVSPFAVTCGTGQRLWRRRLSRWWCRQWRSCDHDNRFWRLVKLFTGYMNPTKNQHMWQLENEQLFVNIYTLERDIDIALSLHIYIYTHVPLTHVTSLRRVKYICMACRRAQHKILFLEHASLKSLTTIVISIQFYHMKKK